MQGWTAALAALIGIAIGYWLRHISAQSEKQSETAQYQALEKRFEVESSSLRAQLAATQAESSGRASYQPLAEERQLAITRLGAERDAAQSATASLQQKMESATAQSAQLIAELTAELAALKASASARDQAAEDKLTLLQNAEQKLLSQFQLLSQQVLEEKSTRFTAQNQQNLDQLLHPLRQQIQDFRLKVEEAQKESLTGRVELKAELADLKNLNTRLSEEAHGLTSALRGSSKAQGDWGEFILRDLLEKAGLREGDQYTYQQSFTGEAEDNGARRISRTDVILTLPGGRHLIIDSKVSLKAYTDFANATTEAARAEALKQHLISLRAHIRTLREAGYQHLYGLESLDFVIMFVPVEPALLAALQNDDALWPDAYSDNVLLAGPTTLLYIIRIVHVLWQQELQSRNIQEIINRGTSLYSKFVGFIADMEAIGKSLTTARNSYDEAMGKLTTGRGNLIGQVEKLRKLGIKPKTPLPPRLIEEDTEEDPLQLAAESEDEA